MQVIVMTSDPSQNRVLPGFAWLFNKYWGHTQKVTVCGFTKPYVRLPENFNFYSIGKFQDFPANRWSDAFGIVLEHLAEEHFVLMLDDYWIFRQVNVDAINILHDYMRQFRYVLKVDLAYDRMGADWGRYFQGSNNYGVAGYIDLIHSPPGSNYQMSLWGGMWNRDLLYSFLVQGETAQQIEMRGTERVNSVGSSVVVLGTRQAPLIHGNLIQSSHPGQIVTEIGGWKLSPGDEEDLKRFGMMPR